MLLIMFLLTLTIAVGILILNAENIAIWVG